MTEDREGGGERVDTSHLDGIDDGCGCAEVWEHLSEGREAAAGAEGDAGSEREGPEGEEIERGVEGGGAAVDTGES